MMTMTSTYSKSRSAAMTCTTCTAAEISLVESKRPGLAGRLLSALRQLRPLPRLDLDRLSRHQLRDLGLDDGHAAAPRDLIRD
jgi:uncharacterized protein YjiS (DUF1127 family)